MRIQQPASTLKNKPPNIDSIYNKPNISFYKPPNTDSVWIRADDAYFVGEIYTM